MINCILAEKYGPVTKATYFVDNCRAVIRRQTANEATFPEICLAQSSLQKGHPEIYSYTCVEATKCSTNSSNLEHILCTTISRHP